MMVFEHNNNNIYRGSPTRQGGFQWGPQHNRDTCERNELKTLNIYINAVNVDVTLQMSNKHA